MKVLWHSIPVIFTWMLFGAFLGAGTGFVATLALYGIWWWAIFNGANERAKARKQSAA